jgi:hypothetical protein
MMPTMVPPTISCQSYHHLPTNKMPQHLLQMEHHYLESVNFVPFFKTRISLSIHRDSQCLFLEADFLMAKHNTLRKEENPTRDTNILAGTLEEILTF